MTDRLISRRAAGDGFRAAHQGALQRLRSRRHPRPERAPPGRRRAAPGRHGPRRRHDAGDLRADLPDLDRRSHAPHRLLSRLQRLAARLLQGGARPAHRPADAAGDARGGARRARAGEGQGRRAPGESHDRQRRPQARRRHHPLLAHQPGDRVAGKAASVFENTKFFLANFLEPFVDLFAWGILERHPRLCMYGIAEPESVILPDVAIAESYRNADCTWSARSRVTVEGANARA
jgi:hypothetical protein